MTNDQVFLVLLHSTWMHLTTAVASGQGTLHSNLLLALPMCLGAPTEATRSEDFYLFI